MNKIIKVSSIVFPKHKSIKALRHAIETLTFNCPVSVFENFDPKIFLNFCEPILVIPSVIPDKYEICAGFRTYQILLALDISKIEVVELRNLCTDQVVQLSYLATLLPLLIFSSPSTHAQYEIRTCLKELCRSFQQNKEVLKSFNKEASKFQKRKRSIFEKTALDMLFQKLNELEVIKNHE